MRTSYWRSGLDQIGPKHWLSEDEIKHLGRLSRSATGPHTISHRVAKGAGRRKPLITLPDIQFGKNMEDDMREFETTRVPYGDTGGHQRGLKIECGICHKVHSVPMGTIKNATPQDQARMASEMGERKFRAAGWTVGKRPSEDRCPNHSVRRPIAAEPPPVAAPAFPAPPASIVKVAPMTKPPSNVAHLPTSSEAPREMSRADRRLVFEKLNECYGHENEGYLEKWTDAAVAKDLGCPRAWVQQVREENFGPEGKNAILAAELSDAAAVMETAKMMVAKHDALVELLGTLESQQKTLAQAIAAVRPEIEKLKHDSAPVFNAAERADRVIAEIRKVVG